MSRRRVPGPFARDNAIRKANSIVAIASQVDAWVRSQRGFDPSDALRVSEDILRHAPGPTMHPGECGGTGHTDSRCQLLPSQCDQRVVVRAENLVLS